ncbi:DUF7507 domain-containing protein [Clostridium folliculivorans]|uniref:DUF11 domain-containing protein n=1 Tax=Clostridium folliculivorans TaxID=2886038 RepID=A0A9W5Y200_9CLOT|nr:hypothetical protein [Clostridium folliculivorans]GKU25135.1 hypothetical protein CFOLD11_19610 [Clostridium folliculivorans]GKU31233.1 hypothetical protein CFB3_33400 [Clostridium folliculivorans]
MSTLERFSSIDKCQLITTGNSLVVCGSTTAPDVNTSDLIKPDGTTTRDWTKSGSTASLNILAKSTVRYAELVWYSTVFSNVSGALDLRSVQDTPVSFTTPKGTYAVTPTYTDSYTSISGTTDRFRAADVTSLVKDALSGSYSVAGVPISVPSSGLSNSRGGWALVVIYRNDVFKPQKVIYSSGISVATPSTPLQATVTGFTTGSDNTILKGNISLVCANGGPLNGNEIVSIGPSFAQLTNVGNTVNRPNPNPGTAPNNPGNSFFSGVINVADPLSDSNGLLNILGTNGGNNHDGFVPTQKLNGRNKWDIANVDISKTLVPNQTLLAGQITEGEEGDGVQLVVVGTQVLSKAPDIIATLDLYDIDGDGQYNVEVGESLVYAMRIRNDGDLAANNVIISAVIDSATSYIPGSVTINGVAYPSANILNGINLGTISSRGIINVLFSARTNSIPASGMLHQNVNYSYQFTSGIDSITNYGNTNTVEVVVQDGLLSITKASSKTNITIGETVIYTMNIQNVGTELATKMFFQDKLDAASSFVEGTVLINGEPYVNYNPVTGFSLPNLAVGNSTQIAFQAKVNSLPPSTKISNISLITFGYVFNQYDYLREKTLFSNSVSIQVHYVEVIGERCNDNNYPKVGDSVIYTLSLTNVGNQPANNVQILEPQIPGASFVSGSVLINGSQKPDLNPFTGFTLVDAINPGQTTDVKYKVLINSMNPADLIENIARVPFKYQISSSGTVVDAEKASNKVDTVANFVCMNVNKSVDKAYAEIGDILYYKINVTNGGNINAFNTVFLDSIQAEASFVNGSVAINGISYPSYDPTRGFTIGIVCPDDVVEVTFQAKVISLPNPNIIYDQASLVYSYKPDPNGNVLSGTIISNRVQTTINKARYTIVKSVDKAYAQVGDALVYTISINNTGTVPLTNLKFADFLGVYLNFYPESLYINGVNYPELDPSSQFSIGNMYPGDTATIAFGAIIASNPPVGYISNISEVTLSYKQNPDSPEVTNTEYSNPAKTYVPFATVALIKAVDKSYAVVGDTLTYRFTSTNTGNTNIINTLFSDTIQAEASFVSGSVLVNGVNKPDYDPQVGFTLGTLTAGQVVDVEFKVVVNSLPTPNTVKNSATTSFSYYIDPTQQPVSKTSKSNTVTTIISSYSATLTKEVDKAYATIGDVLTYTITANNTGTVTLTSVSILDAFTNGATFLEGSVVVDGVSKPSANPINGFTINNILPGGSSVISFKATVTSLPTPPQIKNTAYLAFKYQVSPTSPFVDGSLTSNTVTTNITSMSVSNTKSVSKTYATVGDTLTYTSEITNNGNTSITNTTFIDSVPEHTSFVIGSVKINGVPYSGYDPNSGFTLGTINPGNTISVTFAVTVSSVPPSGYVNNSSILNYQYKIDPSGAFLPASATSNTVTTYINLGNITVTKEADRSIVRLSNAITYRFVLTNTGNTLLRNVFFKDIIQAESSFNTGSVYVNGVNRPSFNPNTGFALNDIPVGQQIAVSFTVTANSIPQNNTLLNKADVTYSYYVDPNGTITTKTKSSNTTTVYVYDTIVSANKSVDKAIAKLGDTLNFTITIKNEGNVPAQHIFFQDILDSQVSFVADSVYIDGVQKPGYNPNNGFNLSDIAAGVTTTVKFAVTVISRSTDNLILNFATINYDYTVGTEVIAAMINTNITQTYVALGELTLTKSVDKDYATLGDDLAYTVIVRNTGSVNATNIFFQDVIASSASFNGGTVVVDGTSQPTYDPNFGFSLTDLAPNGYHIINFSVNVKTLSQSGRINNTAEATFTYRLTQADDPVTITTHANNVTTYIKVGNLTATKEVDKAYATIGDTLNYTVTINNTGNTNCFNVFFKDIIQTNASFVNGSVKVNGVTHADYNPSTGFNLDDIPGYGSTVITFAVNVNSLPQNYIIYNNATIDYKYYVNPANPPIVLEATSNTVSTVINVGSLTATKAVSKAYATLEDLVSYTVTIVNTGNTIAKNVNFRDVIPSGLNFVTGSVKINDVAYPSLNPYSSFTLGNINAGDTVVVKFDTIVTSLPTPSLVSNTANITFSYRINPSGSDIPVIVNSNTVTTQINLGSISLNKTVDKAFSTMGYVLTYTIVVTNNGNVRADNFIFTDNLQSDIAFNQGSVNINGTTMPDYDPNSGFTLGNIAPLSQITVVFTANVIDSPTHDAVLNVAFGTFSYKIDPNGQYYSKSTESNTVSTIIVKPSLTATKVVNKSYATLQDILNYSILVKNTGNTPIAQLFFGDFLSNGAVFKSGTVVIDGISYPAYDPTVGFNLPNNLLAGSTSLVEFQSTVTTLPLPPVVTNYAVSNGLYHVDPSGPTYPISATSNTVATNINIGSLSNTKTVDKLYAKVNDTVTYTSTITNTGNVYDTNIFFSDLLQNELSFISGTVTINGVVYPTLNPQTGFALADLAPGQSITVAFTAKVTALPATAYVVNSSLINFSYKVDPSGTSVTKNQQSNTVTTNVVLGNMTAVKVVDKPIATIGDTLTYTITLTNVGNVIDSEVFFQDNPSQGVSFVAGSVKVNNVSQPSYDPTVGFSLGDIGIGNVVTVQFKVNVVAVPSTNQVTNQAAIPFKYVVDPKQPPFSDTAYSNTVTTNIAYGNLNVTKAVNKQYATIGEQLTYTIVIVNTGNIDATNVVFVDPTPHNSMFVIGSVTVNGVAYPSYNPSAGFNLNTMTPGQIITVVYKVEVVNLC